MESFGRAFEAGPSGYLLKNMLRKELVETIRTVHSDKGSHFAAWERPTEFTADLRAAFKTLR